MARGLKGIKKPHPLGSVPTRSGVSQLTAESGISSVTLLGVKISALPAAGAALSGDQLEVNQGGVSRRVTADQLLAFAAAGSGTVTSTSVVAANGFDGTVANPTTTPAITMKTTVTGMLKGNGTAISAAVADTDYAPAVAGGYLPLSGGTLTGALAGTSAAMSGNITSTGGNITASGGAMLVDRTGDAAPASFQMRTDAAFNSSFEYRTGSLNRWQLLKEATGESGANGGSNFLIRGYDDAGTSLGNYVTITRSTGAVALTGALSGTTATMSGNITSTGGNISATGGSVLVDRTGDAAVASLDLRADSGFIGLIDFKTGTSVRWRLQKTGTGEVSPTNVGSDFALQAFDDSGASLGNALSIARATRAVSFGGALSGTTATFTGTVTAPGAQIQMVSTQTGAVATGTTLIPVDDTIPQITEGDQYMTLAITPKSATSKLVIEVTAHLSSSVSNNNVAALFQDSTANALAASYTSTTSAQMTVVNFAHVMTSGTTSATTFKVRCGGSIAGTNTFNGQASGRMLGGVLASSIVIREVAP